LTSRDRWAEWLAERRFGGDPDVKREFMENLTTTRDRVLDAADLADGETLLDVGCGEGLVAFGALERGASLVVFADISADLLDTCRSLAAELGFLERCRFVRAPADDLSAVLDDSVDVVTTRSVLIYVKDKQRAFEEFHRVLRPGGRISLWEPINRFSIQGEPRDSFAGYDLNGLGEIGAKLRGVYEAAQPRETDPMLDFDERDLVRLAEQAGFFPLRLELRATIERTGRRRWETFLRQSGNPKIPTLGEAMDQALTQDERDELTTHLRPLVEAGDGVWRSAEALLSGVNSSR
jgi:arsenite methyltransferase